MCEEDADGFCEGAGGACGPEVADDEGEALVAMRRETPPDEVDAPCGDGQSKSNHEILTCMEASASFHVRLSFP